jgi:hypothetical protein
MKREKTFMNWLDDTVREWDLEPEVEEEFNRLMLHQRIADLRERAGLTQAELAKRTGVSQPMIAKLESGRADNRRCGSLSAMPSRSVMRRGSISCPYTMRRHGDHIKSQCLRPLR